MNIFQRFFQSSVGKKYIMALSGLGLFLFVVGHLLGNLQVFLGPETINSYGHFLQTTPELIWPARLGLVALVGLHIWAAASLTAQNRAARGPVSYSSAYTPTAASFASRTMMMSGAIIAAFVIYHILHFTVQVRAVNLTGKDFVALTDAKGRHDVYAMMIAGFRHPFVSAFYLLAMGLLCLHLSHGFGALFQSIGLKSKAWGLWIDRLGRVASWVIFLGYASIPVAVLLGFGREVAK
ncbi:MAG: succinate dehydrogenase cytochrome b subunit [Verrucomicrobiales bacterium]|nr:succinate dehydrogenase cytochrome b subunit [Verrucomicrobiales bacterium]